MDNDSTRIDRDCPNTVLFYTDGSCYPNPGGQGGWSFYCTYKRKTAVRYGFSTISTNNEMELTAILHALWYVPSGSDPIVIITDSKYSKLSITEWVKGWRETGWKTAVGEPIKNKKVIVEIDRMLNLHRASRPVEIRWVRGHSGVPENELVDQRANSARVRQETNWTTKDHKHK